MNPDGGGAASNRKGNRMDSMSAFRANWKVRLVAFGIGILVAAAVFGIALGISDDLRLLYVNGALLLAVAAFFLSAKAREDLIAAVLLLFASTFLFAFFVLPQTSFLWPTLLLWVTIVVVAAIPEAIPQNYHNRWRYDLDRGFGLVLRVLHSGADAAHVNARWQWRGAAIHFAANQPESGADSARRPAKFSCSTFSPPGVLHALLSCRSWRVFVPIYRPGATLNSCWLEQTKAAIRLTGSGRLHSVGTSRCRSRLIPNRQRCAHLV